MLGAGAVMYDMERTGATIKYLRTSLGKSQECVSADMGLNIKTYRAIENGVRSGNIESLCVIAEYFNVTLDYLIHGQVCCVEEVSKRLNAFDFEKQHKAIRIVMAVLDNL